MKKFYKNNNKKNSYAFKSGTIACGEVGEVDENEVGAQLLAKGLLEEVEAPEASPEASGDEKPADGVPDAGKDAGADAPDGDAPWTIEDAAAKLVAEPDLLEEGEDFTKSGVPEVAAINVVFDQEFSATERNELWARVLELKAEAAE
jgi:hypothetical protein